MPTAISSVPTAPIVQARAREWFLRSGIQEPEGGVARFYRIDRGKNARISTEITGYAISALCDLYRRNGDPECLQAALRAGVFLLEQAWDQRLGIHPFEWPHSDKAEENRAYFFDCGIIVRGLIKLYRASGEARFLKAAANCGRAMARLFDRETEYAPILQLPDCAPTAYGETWSNNPGCYQLKSALGWRELFLETGEAKFAKLFEEALLRALANDAEFLPGTVERHRVMDRLHAYSYYLEALLSVIERPECAAAHRAGIKRATGFRREIAPEFARSDVYAQILRVRLLSPEPLDETAAREEAAAIAGFQIQSGDRRLDGGFYFGKRNGEMMPFANPVSTSFCMQALCMWEDYQKGTLRDTWRELI